MEYTKNLPLAAFLHTMVYKKTAGGSFFEFLPLQETREWSIIQSSVLCPLNNKQK